jgi:hypothetical protein
MAQDDSNMTDEERKKQSDKDELFKRIQDAKPEQVQPGDESKTVELPFQHAYNIAKDKLAGMSDTAKYISDKLPRAEDTTTLAAQKEKLNQAYTPEGMIENFGGAASGRIGAVAQEAGIAPKLLQETNPQLLQKLVNPEAQALTARAAPSMNAEAMAAFSKLDQAVSNKVPLSAAEAALWQKTTGKVYVPPEVPGPAGVLIMDQATGVPRRVMKITRGSGI